MRKRQSRRKMSETKKKEVCGKIVTNYEGRVQKIIIYALKIFFENVLNLFMNFGI